MQTTLKTPEGNVYRVKTNPMGLLIQVIYYQIINFNTNTQEANKVFETSRIKSENKYHKTLRKNAIKDGAILLSGDVIDVKPHLKYLNEFNLKSK